MLRENRSRTWETLYRHRKRPGGLSNGKRGRPEAYRESDQRIVLRGGRADHRGKATGGDTQLVKETLTVQGRDGH